MDFLVLGPLVVRSQGTVVDLGRRRRERCLLGLLLLQPGRVIAVDRLVDLLWAGDPPERARATLNSHVSRLRGALGTAGGAGLHRHGDGYRLGVEPGRVDAHRFTALVARAETIGDPGRRAGVLREALALWRGDLLADVADAQLRERVGSGLAEQRLGATEAMLAAELACGRHLAAVPLLTDLADAYPYREGLSSLLMLALYRSGRASDALAVYRRARARLAEDLGTEPGAELRRRHEAVLRGDPALDLPAPVVTAGTVQTATVGTVAAGTVPAQLPVAPGYLLGRDSALAELDTVLDAPTPLVVVEGPAGVGKTALALRWAATVREQLPDGQIYLNLRGFAPGPPLSPADALGRLLRTLGVPAAEVPSGADEAAARFRTAVTGRRMLLLLDNASGVDQVRPLLPGDPRCVVVVTSRNRLGGLVALEGARRIVLGTLAPKDAVALLHLLLGGGRGGGGRETAAVAELAGVCGNLPLALRIAGANLAGDPDRTVASYLREAAGALSALSVEGDSQAAVRLAFDLSYLKLPPPAARLFRLLSLVPGQVTTTGAAAALAGTADDIGALLGTLADASLVEQQAPDRYTMHDLIARHARERLATDEPAADRSAAVVRLLDWYLAAFHTAHSTLAPYRTTVPVPEPPAPAIPAFTGEPLAFLEQVREMLPGLVRFAVEEGHPGRGWQMAYLLGPFFQRHGDGPDSLQIYRTGLAAAQETAGPTAQAALHNSAGIAYAIARRLPEAGEHLERAVESFRAAGLSDAVAGALSNLGRLRVEQHQLGDARAAYEEAARLRESTGDTRRLGTVLNNLGTLLAELGENDAALVHMRRALELHRQYGDRGGIAHTLDSIGMVHLRAGETDAALAGFHAALDDLRAVGYREAEGATLANIAHTYLSRGDTGAALDHLRQAAECFRATRDTHRELMIRQEMAALQQPDRQPG
ncbi:BTAD domain-containing putative transcriptional regulator [Actinoplanes sp. CA-252034]|uniref:AfsR/SARP family transcriptional regulator n=1 Tax=Actinoplanes sp. CA-252034 TaxID=3239906 RepID=UPI003D9A058F